jgi:hypothetical protein
MPGKDTANRREPLKDFAAGALGPDSGLHTGSSEFTGSADQCIIFHVFVAIGRSRVTPQRDLALKPE